MSITFSLPREYTAEAADRALFAVPCPECKGHNRYADLAGGERIDADPNCEVCLGYGGCQDSEATYWERRHHGDGEFNVANGNGMFILRDILNITMPDYGGSIDPTTVLMRCAAYTDPSKGVEAATCEQAVRLDENGVGLGPTICYGGRSLEQIESYIDRLTKLATLALERGAPVIHWG